MLNETVNQTINFPGEEDNIKVVYSFKEKALGDNYFSSIKANGIALDVLGQKLTGDIDISPYEQGLNKGVKVNLSNGLGSFGVEGKDGSSLSVNIPTVGSIANGATVEKNTLHFSSINSNI